MLQSQRTWLFSAAYSLDNRKRIKGQGGQLLVMFTHEELERLAEDMRKVAADDESMIAERILGKHHDNQKGH